MLKRILTITVLFVVLLLSQGCTIKADCDRDWANCMDALPDDASYAQRTECFIKYEECLDGVYGY